jgi:hypothetical protein
LTLLTLLVRLGLFLVERGAQLACSKDVIEIAVYLMIIAVLRTLRIAEQGYFPAICGVTAYVVLFHHTLDGVGFAHFSLFLRFGVCSLSSASFNYTIAIPHLAFDTSFKHVCMAVKDVKKVSLKESN